MAPLSRRNLPAVDKVLGQIGEFDLPRPAVVAVVRRALEAWRTAEEVPSPEEIIAHIRGMLADLQRQRIEPVINATGVLIHTNLGRSPLGSHVVEKLAEVASQYCNLEFDLSIGERGGRAAYLEHNLALLCEAEAATVVNNNAGALVLVLRHLCQAERTEVVISRGELVQIGGGFRIPSILEASGATLREVGTTNKTSLEDYQEAISTKTAMVLKVHRSNFFMSGFVDSPTTAKLAQLTHEKQVPLVEDLGSGAVVATETLHPDVEHEPTPAEILRQGVDLVTFSGDKLFGGPQAGILTGSRLLVEGIKREPFFRALRCDKIILTALQVVVDDALHGKTAPEKLTPLHAMLSATMEELNRRAEQIVATIQTLPLQVEIGSGTARIGGGSMPRSQIPSVVLRLQPTDEDVKRLAAKLRRGSPAMVGTIHEGCFCLNLRTVLPPQDEPLVRALQNVVS